MSIAPTSNHMSEQASQIFFIPTVRILNIPASLTTSANMTANAKNSGCATEDDANVYKIY